MVDRLRRALVILGDGLFCTYGAVAFVVSVAVIALAACMVAAVVLWAVAVAR